MYDSATADLIASAPPLEGLDLKNLPQQLTNAYATIVASRVRLRHAAAAALPDDVQQTIEEIKRIAFTNEALVSAVPSRQDRKAAAFVAASAHHPTVRRKISIHSVVQVQLPGDVHVGQQRRGKDLGDRTDFKQRVLVGRGRTIRGDSAAKHHAL